MSVQAGIIAGMIKQTAIGLRAHSGWAALVALAGPAKSPEVIARRRIEIADPKIRGSKQPFHAAEPMEYPDAKAYIDRCTRSTERLAREALQAAIDGLRDRRSEPSGCGIILGSGRKLPDLDGILKSHALIHTAEGEFFRNALVEACKHCGIPVLGVKEKELFERGSAHFRRPVTELERNIQEMGKSVGPPWTQDQKYAALVAWMALGT